MQSRGRTETETESEAETELGLQQQRWSGSVMQLDGDKRNLQLVRSAEPGETRAV